MVLLSMIALFVWYVIWTRDHERPITALDRMHQQLSRPRTGASSSTADISIATSTTDSLHIQAPHIAPKLGNETLKAELGRAAWKLFHTTMAQFPDEPSDDQSEALKSYIYLFARLYPCGECAEHFQQILKKYPPQTHSRSSAAAWACFVHNEVNESKGKEIFDCAKIGDFYDCGCADDEKNAIKEKGKTRRDSHEYAVGEA
jgi:FAD-linked sulfhydryl oxidase